jgi:hypothetical protein
MFAVRDVRIAIHLRGEQISGSAALVRVECKHQKAGLLAIQLYYAMQLGVHCLLLCAVPAGLVKQLLDAGADINDPCGICQLQPLHLACMPCIIDDVQVRGVWGSKPEVCFIQHGMVAVAAAAGC